MRRIYSFLLYLCIPYILFRLYRKGRKLAAYRHRIPERFSLNLKEKPVDVWLHAVSLGEVNAAAPLIKALLAMNLKLVITTMTPTGSDRVTTLFGNRVHHQYLPYDLPSAVRRFYSTYHPKLGIILETELWPNFIYGAEQLSMPLFIINGRISDRAFKQYKRMRYLFKPILNKLTRILVQSKQDAARFIQLGAEESKVSVVGNLKFDMQWSSLEVNPVAHLKTAWGESRPVLLLASTHDNEEEQILTRLSRLQDSMERVLLLIAPRHPERFKDVYELACSFGLKTGLRSTVSSISSDCDVIVIDSLGELQAFYQLSDYSFVGGSLVPIGGHNLLEPIALNVPVITGPYNQNSKAIFESLLAAKAIYMAENADALIEVVIELHHHEAIKKSLVKNANKVFEENQGSLEKNLTLLQPFFPSQSHTHSIS
ncbi:lipid IV(A) 3-deoxy-D-manno-octulosonic acid transferase [Legionella impletisoli]|uniref:3-deoxy-D-manno-octulosonic acid transferase n=1 Tax=Legionella impletisoli TaxID=343510 RepID=A0A917JUV5_9GAMM|nr:lipid IV(A) 3-deoxy-D-manno-octulosonic acid transferase [Legionella impletisoli]GGI86122.1 3-deoxy-D-manno-octulosonic acid transferase [Legionella impletisoli]